MNNKVKISGMNQLPSIDKIFKEEDDDFMPSVGSNLAAIFGTPQKTHENTRVNSPMRYAASKQSAADQNQSKTSAAAKKEVILAKAVHAFKLQNGRYASIGKVGIALIGHTVMKQYDVILYKGTQDYISIVPIAPDFCYTVQENNYASYYDTNKDNWSILFDDNESSVQFAREICISKYFSRAIKNDNNIMYQDLSAAGKNHPAKEGDGISIKYSTSTDTSQPLKIDNNLKETITLEISKDDNWERLLVGTSMGLKRMMIIPSNKQIGLGTSFPKDREIIMEIEVVSVFAKEDVPPPVSKSPEVSQKATIISRMAKMGQSILPKLPPSTTTDSEDTEEEVFHKTSRHKRVESSDSSPPKKHSYSNPSSEVVPQRRILNRGELMPTALPITQRPVLSAQAFAPQWGQNQIQQQYVSIDGQLLPIQQQTINQPISTSMDPTLNIFLSETRTQNTELRMGLSKIGDNVQKLLDKFHVLELQQASTPATDKSLEATLKMLMDINKSKENVENRERDIRSEISRDEASGDQNLLSANEKLKSALKDVENELKEATVTISTRTRCIDELKQENDALNQTNSMLKEQIKELEKKLSASGSKIIDLSAEFQRSKEIESKYKEQNSKLENRIDELTTKCKGMEEKETMLKSETTDRVDKSKEIKGIMIETFLELCDSFPEDNYTADHIKTTIHSTLRNITFRLISEQVEKRREKAEKSEQIKTSSSVLETEINENARKNYEERKSLTNDDEDKDSVPTTLNVIENCSITQSNTVSEFRNEPPPLPKFDMEGSN